MNAQKFSFPAFPSLEKVGKGKGQKPSFPTYGEAVGREGMQGRSGKGRRRLDLAPDEVAGTSPQFFAGERNPQKIAELHDGPGLVFQPVGDTGLLAAVEPWPCYGETSTPAWRVRMLRVGERRVWRYWLAWSVRLRRWSADKEFVRLQADLPPGDLRELDNFMLDTLEGALC